MKWNVKLMAPPKRAPAPDFSQTKLSDVIEKCETAAADSLNQPNITLPPRPKVISKEDLAAAKQGKIAKGKEDNMRNGITQREANTSLVRSVLSDCFMTAATSARRRPEMSGMYAALAVSSTVYDGNVPNVQSTDVSASTVPDCPRLSPTVLDYPRLSPTVPDCQTSLTSRACF